MHFSLMGSNSSLLSALSHLVDGSGRSASAYLRDAKAMAETPADVIEDSSSYSFIVDMPGLQSNDVKVQIEDDGVLVISGERKKREEEQREGVKYLRMERRIGKLLRKFVLPENANVERISAVCNDGVLVVTVEKLPPPAPKTPKTIEVRQPST